MERYILKTEDWIFYGKDGVIQSALLWYIKLTNYLETYSFKFNPYDSCVANTIIEGETLPIVFHVDDIKASNKDTKVVETFEQWIEFMYGDQKFGKVKLPWIFFLDFILHFKRITKTDIWKYVKNMIDEFPINI